MSQNISIGIIKLSNIDIYLELKNISKVIKGHLIKKFKIKVLNTLHLRFLCLILSGLQASSAQLYPSSHLIGSIIILLLLLLYTNTNLQCTYAPNIVQITNSYQEKKEIESKNAKKGCQIKYRYF